MAGTLTATTIQNDTSSPPTFRNNSVEIGRLCRAWVNYNGSTQTITGSFNVSSVTYNGTGDYSINFTTAMPNANYAAVGGSQRTQTSGDGNMTMQIPTQGTTPTTTVLRVATRTASGSAAYQNCDFTQVAVFSS